MRARSPGRRESGGFTLLEIMIAIGVLMIAVVGSIATQMSAQSLLSTTRETATATSDLQAVMEQVLLYAPDQLPTATGRFPAGRPIAAYSNLHLRNERIVPTYPNYSGGTVPDPLSIQLTATWSDYRGRPRTMSLSSAKTK
jgi:type II secretory pathway pseudopilin PulG